MRTDWDRLRESKIRPEINKIIEQPSISEKNVCDLRMLMSIMEKSYTTEMFEEEGDEYSEAYNGSYSNRYSGARRGRGRASYGRQPNYESYNYYDSGYSGHDEKEMFRNKLQDMMRDSQNPEMRHVIQEALDKIR